MAERRRLLRTFRFIYIPLLLEIALLLPAAFGAAKPDPAKQVPAGELRFFIAQMGTEGIDPALTSLTSKLYFTPFYDYLIGVDPDGSLSTKTGVAKSWSLSQDSTTLTIQLRSGIKFHNGDELTSADVKFSLEQFTSPRCVSTNANYLRKVIKDIKTPDPLTVVINYKERSAILPNYLSRQVGFEGVVLPKKYIDKNGLNYFGTHPVGSGPYKFVEYRAGAHIKYEAIDYPHWLVGVPKFKYLTFQIVKEESTRIAALKTGAADIIVISQENIKEVPGFKVYEKTGSMMVGLHVNNQWDTTTYLSNEKFREALALAINREEIKKFIFGGTGVISGSGVCYGSWALGYKPVPLYPYDPVRAKQLVEEAFPGKKPLINIHSYEMGGVPELATLGEAIAGYWQKIGVESKIIPTEYSTYRNEMSKKEPNLRNSVGVMTVPNRLLWDAAFKQLYGVGGLLDLTRDPESNALIDALIQEYNPDMLAKRQFDVAMYLRNHHRQIPLLESGNVLAANPEKVPKWANISIPCVQDFFLEELYTR